jgi:hypothetical protein
VRLEEAGDDEQGFVAVGLEEADRLPGDEALEVVLLRQQVVHRQGVVVPGRVRVDPGAALLPGLAEDGDPG